jgi:hypothetical protein
MKASCEGGWSCRRGMSRKTIQSIDVDDRLVLQAYHDPRTFSIAVATSLGRVKKASWSPSISTTSHVTPELSTNIC